MRTEDYATAVRMLPSFARCLQTSSKIPLFFMSITEGQTQVSRPDDVPENEINADDSSQFKMYPTFRCNSEITTPPRIDRKPSKLAYTNRRQRQYILLVLETLQLTRSRSANKCFDHSDIVLMTRGLTLERHRPHVLHSSPLSHP